MKTDLFNTFKNPGSAYRGKPFWAWNARLETDELRRQIRVMQRMGLGGFFMHARVGLATPYLSDAWFQAVQACVSEAGPLEMEAWLYDEDRWPSGAAGGLVTRQPRYRMQRAVLHIVTDPHDVPAAGSPLAAFTGRIDGAVLSNARRVDVRRLPQPATGESLIVFRAVHEPCSDWFNGYTYLDTMNREAVAAFIRTTHDAYFRRYRAHVGTRIPGIFTDEPHHGPVLPPAPGGTTTSLPWTRGLSAAFRHRYGYDLLAHLHEVVFDIAGVQGRCARHDYHDCITALFVDAFARQIGAWCDRHNMQHTGHILCEETLSSQTNMVGSTMRFYEYMQAPGMDVLTEHSREYDTAKQVASVAHQFGRRWRLTETYGCTGWDFSFEGHKALGDWQAALGITLRAQHLCWYSMRGEAKRDYPASTFFQSPWWEHYRVVEDYFARIHSVMTRGAEVRDVLVIHPVESMWLMAKHGWHQAQDVSRFNRMLQELRDSLLCAHIDFDYGDEDILARHGRVQKHHGAPCLHLAQAAYKAVIVPPMLTMRDSTLSLLQRFKHAGGEVVFAGAPPRMRDAEPSHAVRAFAAQCRRAPAKGPRLPKAVEHVARRISIFDEHGAPIAPALYLLREDNHAAYLFICNTGLTARQMRGSSPMVRDRRRAFPRVVIHSMSGYAGQPLEFDPADGAIYQADATCGVAGWEVRTSLPRLGSRLFVFPKKTGGPAFAPRPVLQDVRAVPCRITRWPITLSEPNVLVLDRPAFKIGTGNWQPPQDILRVDLTVRDALKLPRRGGKMKQPWTQKPAAAPPASLVTLRYLFDVEVPPHGQLCLALESPERFTAALNGSSVSMEAECGWWVDPSLRTVPLDPSAIRTGTNELILTCRYDAHYPGFEMLYLLGQFGVTVRGDAALMTPMPRALRLGYWTSQGLAFYSGNVTYHTTITPEYSEGEHVFVQVPRYRGVAVRILVNGTPAGVIAWEPHECEITALLHPGANTLSIEVLGHRRNSHGPLHHVEKWPAGTGPGEFVTTGAQWTDAYQLVPCGLLAAPRLVVRR